MFCSEIVVTEEVPANMEALVAEKRRELIEVISEVDDKLADAFLADEPISSADLEVWLEAKGKNRFLVGPRRWEEIHEVWFFIYLFVVRIKSYMRTLLFT